MNIKAAATLTGSLLARKGAAYPAAYSVPTPSADDSGDSDAAAARNRAYNDPRVIASAPPAPVAPAAGTDSPLVEPSAKAEPAPVEPPPAEPSQAEPSQSDRGPQMQDGRFVEDVVETPVQTPEPEAAPEPAPEAEADLSPETDPAGQPTESPGMPHSLDKMGRVRLSVRLDPDRYLRVKMASARTRWSAQDIVIAALDKFLDGQPGNDASENGNEDGG